MTLRAVIHLALHLAVPGAVAWLAYRPQWRRAWIIMMAGMLVDIDHVVADPIYDPARCSIGFHPLHTAPAVGAYGVLALVPQTRILGVGLLIHMALDALDCALLHAGLS